MANTALNAVNKAYSYSSCDMLQAGSSGHSNLARTATNQTKEFTTEQGASQVRYALESLRGRIVALLSHLQGPIPEETDRPPALVNPTTINQNLEISLKEIDGANSALGFIEQYLF